MGNCFNFFTEMPTEKYAEMLARTTRTETQNIAMIGKALDDGNDLVECSTVTPTCDLCALYQGRIYSVSGRTPGYPSLYETAFRHGYSIIHPNCRHQFFPYNPKFHTEAERQALEEGTRRPWIGGQQGEDARAEYAKSQMQMRRWNKELNEFAEMQKLYSTRGEKQPYTSLGAFRRAYRSQEGTLAYAKSHYYHRDEKEFKEFESVIGKENMPKTLEKFQELKYNKIEDYRMFKHYCFARDKGKISALASFTLFKSTKTKIEHITIGRTAANGTVIQSVSLHFVDRIIGTIYEKNKHEGMSLKDMQNILFNGSLRKAKIDRDGRVSQKMEIDGVGTVTINPETGELVQCNRY